MTTMREMVEGLRTTAHQRYCEIGLDGFGCTCPTKDNNATIDAILARLDGQVMVPVVLVDEAADLCKELNDLSGLDGVGYTQNIIDQELRACLAANKEGGI